jgi:hypothetical protein
MTEEEIKGIVRELVDECLSIPETSFRFGRNAFRMVIEWQNAKLTGSFLELIERARSGDKHAEAAVRLEAGRRLRAGEKLEEPFASFVADVLEKLSFPYKRSKGDQTLRRNVCALSVLWKLDKMGIRPTQNREP